MSTVSEEVAMNALSVGSPVVKWAGGKTRLLSELLARLPPRWGRYYEPFAGGAALLFRLRPQGAVLGDLNVDLMTMYRAVARDPEAVLKSLRAHARRHSAAHYYATRSSFNSCRQSWNLADRAAAFIYLNRTCFNGLWRVNRAGEFNVPIGRYSDPLICVPDALRAAHEVLKRVELRGGHFRDAVHDAKRGDLVYFDPPYYPATATATFTSYTCGAFGPDDQGELADVATRLVRRGVHVILSNSDSPLVRALYRGFRIDSVRCLRSINSVVSRRGEVTELIITGAPYSDSRRSR